jgi:hypothetical protein
VIDLLKIVESSIIQHTETLSSVAQWHYDHSGECIMDERRWLASADPYKMLAALADRKRPVVVPPSDRKLRLFVCACLRRVWDDLGSEWGHRAVEVGERFADGLASERETEQLADEMNFEIGEDEHSRYKKLREVTGLLKRAVFAVTLTVGPHEASNSLERSEKMSLWCQEP